MFLRDEPALVLLACKQGHVAFVMRSVKNKKKPEHMCKEDERDETMIIEGEMTQ